MIRLPLSLTERLAKLFPRAKDRDHFIAEVLRDALDEAEKSRSASSAPVSVGGTLHLFTDGGSRGNPGEAAVGCVLIDPLTGNVVKEYKEAIGIHTNNVAEYKALIIGLELALHYRPNRLVCHLDSELIVKQLSGEYRVKMPTLKPLLDQIQELLQEFKEVSFRHVPREKNAHADKLVNQALDSKRS